jgi:hypothetical protein
MIFLCVKIEKGSGRKRVQDNKVEKLIECVVYLVRSNDIALLDVLPN